MTRELRVLTNYREQSRVKVPNGKPARLRRPPSSRSRMRYPSLVDYLKYLHLSNYQPNISAYQHNPSGKNQQSPVKITAAYQQEDSGAVSQIYDKTSKKLCLQA